jgi:hypothetical protein
MLRHRCCTTAATFFSTFDDDDADSLGLSGEISTTLTGLPRLSTLTSAGTASVAVMARWPCRSHGSSAHSLTFDTSTSLTLGLVGEIPPQLGNLSRLVSLNLSSFDLYSRDLSWLKSLASFQHLDMSLNAPLAWQRHVNMLPSLCELSLSDCGLM